MSKERDYEKIARKASLITVVSGGALFIFNPALGVFVATGGIVTYLPFMHMRKK